MLLRALVTFTRTILLTDGWIHAVQLALIDDFVRVLTEMISSSFLVIVMAKIKTKNKHYERFRESICP